MNFGRCKVIGSANVDLRDQRLGTIFKRIRSGSRHDGRVLVSSSLRQPGCDLMRRGHRLDLIREELRALTIAVVEEH